MTASATGSSSTPTEVQPASSIYTSPSNSAVSTVTPAYGPSPIDTTFLVLAFDPPHARPPFNAVIAALGHCTRFRFHHREVDETADPASQAQTEVQHAPTHNDKDYPNWHKVEFEDVSKARKAYATVQNVRLRIDATAGSSNGCDPAPPSARLGTSAPSPRITLSLLLESDKTPDKSSEAIPDGDKSNSAKGSASLSIKQAEARLAGNRLNVSELPPSCSTAAAIYDRFVRYGPLYRVAPGEVRSSAQLTYYSASSAQQAEQEDHMATLDGYQIIVRKPSKYDVKDSFKNPAGLPGVSAARGPSTAITDGSGTGQRRVVSDASGMSSNSKMLSASAKPYLPFSTNELAAMSQPLPPSPSPSGSASKHYVLHAPIMQRSVSQPVRLMDPLRVIMRQVPLTLDASTLNTLLVEKALAQGPPAETSIFKDRISNISAGIAVVRFNDKEAAQAAVEKLDGKFLEGYEEGKEGVVIPLMVKLFEPKGSFEQALRQFPQHDNTASSSFNHNGVSGQAAQAVPQTEFSMQKLSIISLPGSPDNARTRYADASFASSTTDVSSAATADTSASSSTIVSPKAASSHSRTTSSAAASSSILKKHRKLLSTALDDIEDFPKDSLFSNDADKAKLLELLLVRLPEEERARCILEERYLVKRSRALRELFWDDEDAVKQRGTNSGSPESPTRHYDRKDLLHLYTPQSPTDSRTDAMIQAISAPNNAQSGDVSPTRDRKQATDQAKRPTPSKAQAPNDLAPADAWSTMPASGGGLTSSGKLMDINTLARFTVKGIMNLAESGSPPLLLQHRSAETVKAVDANLKSLEGLKSSQQKQKIGEKVFKVFKTKAPSMKNLSKRTVLLLDQEDLGALLHLTEEFPDILVAKAMAMEF